MMGDQSTIIGSASNGTKLQSPSNTPWHPFSNLPLSKRTPLTIERALGFWFERGISRPQKADRPYVGDAIPDLLGEVDQLNMKYRSVPKKQIGESQELQDELTRLFNQLAPRLWPDYPQREQARWLVDAAVETNDPFYTRDLFASKPEDAQILHSLFCELIIAKLMKKSENNARDERERKRKSTLLEEAMDHSSGLRTTDSRSSTGRTALHDGRDSPSARPQSPGVKIKEADDLDLVVDEDPVSDGSEDSVIPFRAHNWNAVNTTGTDSVASRTRTVPKKSSKAISEAGMKRPADTDLPRRARSPQTLERVNGRKRQLIVKLKSASARFRCYLMVIDTGPYERSPAPQPPRESSESLSNDAESSSQKDSFKRMSLPLQEPARDQYVTEEPPTTHDDQFRSSSRPTTLPNGTTTKRRRLSTSQTRAKASLHPHTPSESVAANENSVGHDPRHEPVKDATNIRGTQAAVPHPTPPRYQTESNMAEQGAPSLDLDQNYSTIKKRVRCYFDMADAIGRPGMACFPLSMLVDADSLFSTVELYLPEAFQRQHTPKAISISLFRPATNDGACELPFEPCFIRADPWNKHTFETFFHALKQQLNTAGGMTSPPHLLLSAAWEPVQKT